MSNRQSGIGVRFYSAVDRMIVDCVTYVLITLIHCLLGLLTLRVHDRNRGQRERHMNVDGDAVARAVGGEELAHCSNMRVLQGCYQGSALSTLSGQVEPLTEKTYQSKIARF